MYYDYFKLKITSEEEKYFNDTRICVIETKFN